MYLEHVNITVKNIDESIKFLSAAFPEFKVRGQGEDADKDRWLHFGTEQYYIALQQNSVPHTSKRRRYIDVGVNHLGFVVEDLSGISNRLTAAGYKCTMQSEPHEFRDRMYFVDNDEVEWEFVEYFSSANSERNEY